MRQQVNDIYETLFGTYSRASIVEEKTVDSPYAEGRTLNSNVGRLLKGSRALRKRLEKYDNPPKGSGNSRTHPSKEPTNWRLNAGQAAEGTTRTKADLRDEIEVVPSMSCRECGRDLEDVEGEPDYLTQEVGLPPITPVYRTHIYNKVYTCGCCNRDCAPWKTGGNVITLGNAIRAVATCPSVVRCMPYGRPQASSKRCPMPAPVSGPWPI